MNLDLHLTGLRPMLQHNGRLANPLDPWTQQLKALTGKRKKTDDDLIAIMQVEARGAIYETPEGVVGLPTSNVWRAIYDAATAYRLGADIKRALSFEDVTLPLLVDGSEVMADVFLKEPDNIDYRSVRNPGQKSRVMRARPIVRDWSCTHSFELLDEVVDGRALRPVLERAGRLVGLGDWRPTYGTFSVEVR